MLATILPLLLLAQQDPLAGQQWHLQPRRRPVVALIDSGLDLAHEDLAANLWVNPGEVPGNGVDDDGNGYVDDVHGWDFVDADGDPTDPCYGHGTSTAGVLGAVADNGVGIRGAAPDVRLMVLRVLGCGGTSTEQRLVDAVEYAAANGAEVIQAVVFVSQAWGVPCWDQPGCLPALCQAIEGSELLFVCPAGNEGLDLSPPVHRYPPSCGAPNVITVTASTAQDRLASFASVGAVVDLAAPGEGVWTTVQAAGNPLWTGPDGYKAVDGASYATPQVTALAVKLLAMDPRLDARKLKRRVLEHVDALPQYAALRSGGRLSAFGTPPYQPDDPPTGDGPVLHLKLDDASWSDSSGRGNDMSCGACPTMAPGLYPGGGLSADFQRGWLERGDAALAGAFPSGGADRFSIAAHVELDAVLDRQPLACKQSAGGRGWLLFSARSAGGAVRMEVWPAGASAPTLLTGATQLAAGTSYHVAVTYDGALLRLYVDGALDVSIPAAPPRANAEPLVVGRYVYGSYERHLDGRLDDLRVYDRALTAAEVAALAR